MVTTRASYTGRIAAAAALAAALALGACSSDKSPWDPDKPLDKMTKAEWCAFYAHYLTNPKISAATRASATEQMRARGCANHA